MGAVALSQKKAEELMQEFRTRFNMTEEEGRALIDKFQDAARENQRKLEEIAQQEVRNTCERMGIVTKEEFEKLRTKVLQLESQLMEMEK